MKRIFTSALIITLTIGAAQAQDTPDRQGHRKEHKMEVDQLNLSAEQKTKLKVVNEDFRKQMTELKKQDQLTVAEMKKRSQALQEKHQAQVNALLTSEQKDQLAKMKADHKDIARDGKGRFNKGGHDFGKRGTDLQKELNLTEDQQQKVSKIRAEGRTKMEALRNDNSLSQDQKREKMREIMKSQQEEMRSVLTKEQAEKMKSLRQGHNDQKERNTK